GDLAAGHIDGDVPQHVARRAGPPPRVREVRLEPPREATAQLVVLDPRTASGTHRPVEGLVDLCERPVARVVVMTLTRRSRASTRRSPTRGSASTARRSAHNGTTCCIHTSDAVLTLFSNSAKNFSAFCAIADPTAGGNPTTGPPEAPGSSGVHDAMPRNARSPRLRTRKRTGRRPPGETSGTRMPRIRPSAPFLHSGHRSTFLSTFS